jgi:hypothetical protein
MPPGNCFHVGFTYLHGGNFRPEDYGAIKNRGALPAAAVQLAWLGIGDQVGHNQYLWNAEQILPDGTTRKMTHFFLVDQAQMFGTWDWTKGTGDPAAPYQLPDHLCRQFEYAHVEAVVERVRRLDESAVADCFSGFPRQWSIEPSHVGDAQRHLLERREHLSDILRANWV